jgi:predicted regulator of Ras-like GTPase activity (Roadblock/LC7/MglB family)
MACGSFGTRMDAAQALADLTEISSQIRAAVLFDEAGEIAASTVTDEGRAHELAQSAAELLEAAEGLRVGGEEELTQLEAATTDGSVFVVRQGPRRIVATTNPEPTVGLVFYDLKSCLRGVEDEAEQPKPRRRTRKKKDEAEVAEEAEAVEEAEVAEE